MAVRPSPGCPLPGAQSWPGPEPWLQLRPRTLPLLLPMNRLRVCGILTTPRPFSPECQASPGSEGLRESGSRVGSAALFCAVT